MPKRTKTGTPTPAMLRQRLQRSEVRLEAAEMVRDLYVDQAVAEAHKDPRLRSTVRHAGLLDAAAVAEDPAEREREHVTKTRRELARREQAAEAARQAERAEDATRVKLVAVEPRLPLSADPDYQEEQRFKAAVARRHAEW